RLTILRPGNSSPWGVVATGGEQMFRWLKKLVVVAAIVPVGIAPAIGSACCGAGNTYQNAGATAVDTVTNVSMTMDMHDDSPALDVPTIRVPGIASDTGRGAERVF